METDFKAENMSTREAELPKLVEEVQQRLKEYELELKPRTDSAFVSKFLRVRKYDVEAASDSIQRYYGNIYRNLQRVQGIRPSDFTAAYDSNFGSVLKSKVDGRWVIFYSVRNWDTQVFSFRDFQLSSMFIQEEIMNNVEAQICGVILVLDLAGFGFSHLRQCSISEVRISVQSILEGVPVKFAGVHVLNLPAIFWPIYKVISQILPEKISRRMHLHSNVESLHKHVERSILPKCLGGVLDEQNAYDKELISKLLTVDNTYEEYWNEDERHVEH